MHVMPAARAAPAPATVRTPAAWSPVIAGAWMAVAWSVLAFGAVYPWAYWPLLAGLACVGAAGLASHHREIISANRRTLIAFVAIAVAMTIQLVPVPREALLTFTPETDGLLRRMNLAFAAAPGAHPISVEPAATLRALLFFTCLGAFALGLAGALSRHGAAALAVGAIVLGVIVALVAIVQRSAGNGLIYGFWKPQEGGIPYGPFVNRNHFAGWTVMVVSLSLGVLCARTASVAGQKLPDWRARILWLSSPAASKLILLGSALAVMSVALVLTLSRSGIAAFAVALAVMGVFVRRDTASGRHKLALSAYLAILVMVGSVAAGTSAVVQRFAAANWIELGDRRTAWALALDIASDFPIAGAGINTFGTLSPVYTENALPVHYGEAHNDYLQLVAEGGLLVCVPAAAGVWLLVSDVRRRFGEADRATYWLRAGATTGVLAMAFQEIVDFSLQIPGNAACFAMLLAIAIHRPRPPAHAIEGADSCAPRWRPSRR
jgi:O-antigen ligase